MSLITNVGQGEYAAKAIDLEEYKKGEAPAVSSYKPTTDESDVRNMIIKHFTRGYTTMYRPRNEFDDMSVIGRMQVDQMSYNTYHPSRSAAFGEGEEVDREWRSNATHGVIWDQPIRTFFNRSMYDGLMMKWITSFLREIDMGLMAFQKAYFDQYGKGMKEIIMPFSHEAN